MHQEIIIKDLELPNKESFRTDVNWLCEALGLVAGRDTERISPQIVITLLKNTKQHITPMSSEQLAQQLHIETQRVNYHLRSLINTGLLYRERRKIHLRQGSMQAAVEELRKDANRIFDRLEKIAADIDKNAGINKR